MFESQEKYLKNKKVKMRFKELEPQEVFLDSLAQKKEREIGISEKKIEVPLSRKILQGFFILISILILFLLIKAFQLQVKDHKKFQILAEENKFIIQQIEAERGVIYDRNLNQLVFNKPSFDLILNKKDLPKEENEKTIVLKKISNALGKSLEELREKIEENNLSEVLILENLPHQTLILLEAKIAANELPGFQIERNFIREYKDGDVLSHLIGYTGKITSAELKSDPENYSIFDYVGRAGIENSYEKILRKDPGKLQIERDAKGNLISKKIIKFPESGKSLVLWLDSDLQRKIYEVLEKNLKILGSQKAAAVALDPKTGGVLALVSLPSFDNNLFQKDSDPKALQNLLNDPQEPLFNRVISGKYPTGSTIKPLIASAVLQEKIISPEKQIYAGGQIEVPHRYNPEIVYTFKDWKVHGWTDLRKAIADSVNVYFYTVGGGYKGQEGLGPSRIKKYLELFGWNKKTEIDLPGEAEGFIPDKEWKKRVWKEGWWDGDTYLLSIGQGYLLITPLEVATSFLAIANGGKLFQPQNLKEIVDKEKNLIEKIEPKIIRELNIDPKNLQIVREGMREAVTYGSAVMLNNLPVKAAAKTGTAETPKANFYHNWITVFAPYENPEIVLTIVIEDVKGFQVAALPVAKEILEWYFTKK